jgi:very-short-patch-repair endonuclease
LSISNTENRLYFSIRKALQGRDLGLKRQEKIGRFTADFCFTKPRVVVEVEGPFHDTPQHEKHDRERMNYLTNIGYRVLRISTEQIGEDVDSVARFVVAEALRAPAGADSPPLDKARQVKRVLIEYESGDGDWLEGEEAANWWAGVRELLVDSWTHGGEAYHTHVKSHWNHYVTSDRSISARVVYESGPDGDAHRFATRLLGRHIVGAKPESDGIIIKIDLAS